MSYYLRMGSNWRVIAEEDISLTKELPVGNYIVSSSPFLGYYLSPMPEFEMPAKLYGNVETRAERVLKTFNTRKFSTGCHFTGLKGSGKTLLSRTISMKAKPLGMSTLIINNPYKGDDFSEFLGNVGDNHIVLFDEFEKVYSKEDQSHILTLLDGVFQSRKLFLFTTNDKYKVTEYMHNRPGRIYYHLEYKGLEREFVEDFCNDNLADKKHTTSVVAYSQAFPNFNFDQLNAIVSEMNMYGENLAQVLEYLNVQPEESAFRDSYTIIFSVKGIEKVLTENFDEFSPTRFTYRAFVEKDSDWDDAEEGDANIAKVFSATELRLGGLAKAKPITFTSQHLTKFDHTKGEYEYTVGDFKLIVRKNPPKANPLLHHLSY